jgi:hypothetical protein
VTAVPIVLLLGVLATPGGSSGVATVPLLALAPISDEALHGCRAAEVEKALRGRLTRAKRFRLVREDDRAHAVLEILECSRAERQEGELTAKGGPVSGGTRDGGLARGADREVGMQTRTIRLVALRGRVMSGERFFDVASGPTDRSLSEAVDTLRRAIDEALKTRGAWLVASEP